VSACLGLGFLFVECWQRLSCRWVRRQQGVCAFVDMIGFVYLLDNGYGGFPCKLYLCIEQKEKKKNVLKNFYKAAV